MAQHRSTFSNPTQELQKAISQLEFYKVGLYEVHKKVVRDKGMRCYGLFYDKGAASWYELEKGFTQVIERVIGKRAFDPLKNKYL